MCTQWLLQFSYVHLHREWMYDHRKIKMKWDEKWIKKKTKQKRWIKRHNIGWVYNMMPVCADVPMCAHVLFICLLNYMHKLVKRMLAWCTKGTERQTLTRWISAKHEQTLKLHLKWKRCHSHRIYTIYSPLPVHRPQFYVSQFSQRIVSYNIHNTQYTNIV